MMIHLLLAVIYLSLSVWGYRIPFLGRHGPRSIRTLGFRFLIPV